MNPGHGDMLGEKSDQLGQEAVNKKGKQKSPKKRNWEFTKNKEKGMGLTKPVTSARCLWGSAGNTGVRRGSHKNRKQTEE